MGTIPRTINAAFVYAAVILWVNHKLKLLGNVYVQYEIIEEYKTIAQYK